MELSLRYSFGGTPDCPLVARQVVVHSSLRALDDPDTMQEALLERTDALLDDLCAVFDAACSALHTSAFTDTVALDICAGAVFYATRKVLDICPTTAYGKMLSRVQLLLSEYSRIARVMGQQVGDNLLTVIMPAYKTLLRIDNSFAQTPIT